MIYSPLRAGFYAFAFGAIAAIDIRSPVPAAVISGKIKASEVLSGLFMSKSITMKKTLVANVVEEYSSPTLPGRFSSLKGGLT
ncbi:hypothetical protein ACMFFK_20590 [Serratia marcescens]|uniref:hypothetical protein n=1 Tax=Serratia marcescens TaxID=615 RepID=UPI0013FDB805|nr:hypothetical protein [Serratia marcescens]MCX2170657.1 hypothetical protein [Serratia marcescens]MCX2176891.1 hypothetical protein [Serratia marcescens]QLJ62126.1 hypothetical protein HP475_20385 [Serratia marcescens]